jgi:branched-chain amino acid transport system substrate-binding protein
MTNIIRTVVRAAAFCITALAVTAAAQAQAPIKIGLGIAQTGTLSGGGKAALVALQMWRDDVNAKGGLLGRKVELISYDDQSSAQTTPGIYSKLIDVDKVDLLIAPYGTVPTAPLMPMMKQRGLLLMGNFSFQANHSVKHDMWFNNAPWGDAGSWSEGFFKLATKVNGKTVAFLAADQEFAQNLANGAREIAKNLKMETVYSQNYPPTTVDFSSMVRAIRAAKPDIVFVCSYPNDSAAIVRAANEIGMGDSVKLMGGGMVGLQFTPIMEALGSQLNGIVNYNSYVPGMDFPGIKEYLERYNKRAIEAKVDPLGYYITPFNYATGQMIEQAVNATKSLDHKVLADYFRKNEMKTIVGNYKYGPDGERATPNIVTIQFRDIVDKNVEQFRQPGKQMVLEPSGYKGGELVFPYEKARSGK